MSGRATIQDVIIQSHNERPAAVWSAGGSDYDQISRGIADAIEHSVVRLNPQPGERILDLATGTGWTSRAIARRGATVTGVDIAADLLVAARARAEAEALPIQYRLGDAESLPFEAGEFDAVVSTFGIMFASRPEAAAEELARVCRKGGRIALTTWAPDGNLFTMFQVMKRYAPPPPSPAPPSPFEWGRTERIQQLLELTFSLRFEKASRTTASRAARRHGTRSRTATDPRDRWRPASLRPSAARSARTSWRSTMDSAPSSASVCRASTG